MYQGLLRTLSSLTRNTSNDVPALLDLPANIFLDLADQVHKELEEEAKARKRARERQEAERQRQAAAAKRRGTSNGSIARRR